MIKRYLIEVETHSDRENKVTPPMELVFAHDASSACLRAVPFGWDKRIWKFIRIDPDGNFAALFSSSAKVTVTATLIK